MTHFAQCMGRYVVSSLRPPLAYDVALRRRARLLHNGIGSPKPPERHSPTTRFKRREVWRLQQCVGRRNHRQSDDQEATVCKRVHKIAHTVNDAGKRLRLATINGEASRAISCGFSDGEAGYAIVVRPSSVTYIKRGPRRMMAAPTRTRVALPLETRAQRYEGTAIASIGTTGIVRVDLRTNPTARRYHRPMGFAPDVSQSVFRNTDCMRIESKGRRG